MKTKTALLSVIFLVALGSFIGHAAYRLNHHPPSMAIADDTYLPATCSGGANCNAYDKAVERSEIPLIAGQELLTKRWHLQRLRSGRET